MRKLETYHITVNDLVTEMVCPTTRTVLAVLISHAITCESKIICRCSTVQRLHLLNCMYDSLLQYRHWFGHCDGERWRIAFAQEISFSPQQGKRWAAHYETKSTNNTIKFEIVSARNVKLKKNENCCPHWIYDQELKLRRTSHSAPFVHGKDRKESFSRKDSCP